VFIKYEVEVSSRVSGCEWGVVEFGKLFTETNEQLVEFSARRFAVIRTKFDLEHCEGDL